MDAFENQIFESKYRPEVDIDIDLTPDSNTYGLTKKESYGLTKKELQMFRKRFSYKNPEELRQTLIETNDKKYYELLRDLNIILTVLKEQINTKTGVSRARLENLVNVVEDILDSVRWRVDIPELEIRDLENEESSAQRKNQPGRGLKILNQTKYLVDYQFL